MEERRNYVCRILFNQKPCFLIWSGGEKDQFVRDENDRLLAAGSENDLYVLAASHGLELDSSEPTDYDFDAIEAWCADADVNRIDCRRFLDAWNFFDDLAGVHHGPDTEYAKRRKAAAEQYDKLFWGNNIPAMTPEGEQFVPTWTKAEVHAIRHVMQCGISVLQSELANAQ